MHSDPTVDSFARRLHEAAQLDSAQPGRRVLALCDEIVVKCPPRIVKTLAEAALATGNPLAAEELFGRILAAGANDVDSLYGLSRAYRAQNRFVEALEAFSEAFELDSRLSPLRPIANPHDIIGLVDRLISMPPAELDPFILERLKEYGEINAQIIQEHNRDVFLNHVTEVLKSVRLFDELIVNVIALLQFLGLSKNSPLSWNARVFHEVALPIMKAALRQEAFGLGLSMENLIYQAYVMQRETEPHFRTCFSNWVDDMRQAGHRASASEGGFPLPGGQEKCPNVGFFVHNDSLLAHTELLLAYLEANRKIEPALLVPRVYVLSDQNPGSKLGENLRELGVPVTWLSDPTAPRQDNPFERLISLRRQAIADDLAAMVWVSLAVFMPFAFAFRVAPVQIWWAMKYHSLELDEIDGYVSRGAVGKYRRIQGRNWRIGALGLPNWHQSSLAQKAKVERQRFQPCSVLLGCIGREEKIHSVPFLESVATILKRNPGSVFLWTGRNQTREIQDYFEKAGIGRQCIFVGWIDTRLYAQVLDIFLDSFPFPCGFTLVQSMAAGAAIVTYGSRESHETGLHGFISPILDGVAGTREEQATASAIYRTAGEVLYLCARNSEEYVDFACRLIADKAFRKRCGMANRKFVEQFLNDPMKMARTYSEHFVDIINEKRESNGG